MYGMKLSMTEEGDPGIIDKIGINVRRHKEIIHRLYELVQSSGVSPMMSTSQLIDLIANEPTFTKKECVYLGLYLASMNQENTNVPASS